MTVTSAVYMIQNTSEVFLNHVFVSLAVVKTELAAAKWLAPAQNVVVPTLLMSSILVQRD